MNKKGFTLIELLVVLVIIGVIIGLILPNTLKAIEEANAKQTASDIRAINTAIQLCYSSTRDWNSCNTMPLLTNNKTYLDRDPSPSPFGNNYNIVEDLNLNGVKGFEVDWKEHFVVWPPAGSKDLVK